MHVIERGAMYHTKARGHNVLYTLQCNAMHWVTWRAQAMDIIESEAMYHTEGRGRNVSQGVQLRVPL